MKKLLQTLKEKRAGYVKTSENAPDPNVRRISAGIAEGLRMAMVEIENNR